MTGLITCSVKKISKMFSLKAECLGRWKLYTAIHVLKCSPSDVLFGTHNIVPVPILKLVLLLLPGGFQ